MKTNAWLLFIVLQILMILISGTASASPVKENLGQYVISFSTPLVDNVKVLPMVRDQTNSGLDYQSYELQLYNYSGRSLGNIIITKFAGPLINTEPETRKKELAKALIDQGYTKITTKDITVDNRNGILITCESSALFVFEYRITSSTIVLGTIYLPWDDSIKDLIDTLHVRIV